jgi:hypothetical protein
MKIIRSKDMLSVMNMRLQDGQPVPFSFEFVTCNEKTNEGGEIIFFDKAVQIGSAVSKSEIKNPNNFKNLMRNIQHVNSDRIIKIDPWLVRKFNDMEVQL